MLNLSREGTSDGSHAWTMSAGSESFKLRSPALIIAITKEQRGLSCHFFVFNPHGCANPSSREERPSFQTTVTFLYRPLLGFSKSLRELRQGNPEGNRIEKV